MKRTSIKMSKFLAFFWFYLSISSTTSQNHVMSSPESNVLHHLTVDSLVRDEVCAKIIHDNPCVEKVLEKLLIKIDTLDKRFDSFSAYQKIVEENFSELHILKHNIKVSNQKKNEKLKQAASMNEKQQKNENSKNEDTRKSPLRKLFKSFWHKLKTHNWLENIDAYISNNVDDSTQVLITIIIKIN